MTPPLTHPEWDKETGGLEVAQTFADQIYGKNILITGISPSSIGSSIALALASQSPSLLILASRTAFKLEKVLISIQDAYPTVTIKIILLDLMSQVSVRTAAENVSTLTDRLDLIINNAGFMTQKRLTTAEGIEGQFGANHIGHFLLTNLLTPQLLKSGSSSSSTSGSTRIVNLTSLGHRLSPVRFSDYNLQKANDDIPEEERHAPLPPTLDKLVDGYKGFIAYGQAKSANILFSVGVNERMVERGVRSYAVHPGSIWTDLSRDLDEDGEAAIRKTSPFWKNRDQGAATVLVAALDPALSNPREGVLLHDCQMCDAAPHATDPKFADRLWSLSEELVKQEFRL